MSENGRGNQFGWRCIPNIGKPGAALSRAFFCPVDATYLVGGSGRGKTTRTKANPLHNPLRAPAVNTLADLPVLEYRECLYAKAATNLRQDVNRDLG